MKFSIQKLFSHAILLLLLTAPQLSLTRTADEWRTRSIYQLLTDRFAQAPGQENPQLCSNNQDESQIRHYCGGTFSGIISKLDYIKNMVIHSSFNKLNFLFYYKSKIIFIFY
jgi:alpha-amylase